MKENTWILIFTTTLQRICHMTSIMNKIENNNAFGGRPASRSKIEIQTLTILQFDSGMTLTLR